MKVWVLTREENQYDQYGEYFEAVFSEKPSAEQLESYTDCPVIVQHVLETGGGRISIENTWYFLREIDC